MDYYFISDFLPEIAVFYCQQTLNNRVKLPERIYRRGDFFARIIILPCSCKVEVYQILKLLEKGIDGVQLIFCSQKKCRFLICNDKQNEFRINYVRNILSQTNIEERRLSCFIKKTKLTVNNFIELTTGYAKQIKNLGPNPMKGTLNNDYCRMETFI